MPKLQKYLPKLKDGKDSNEDSIAAPNDPGRWDEKQGLMRLAALAKAIDVPPGHNDVHSVPDPWARVILFERALNDSTHALHPQVLGEWRGLLAILGLRERMAMEGLTAYEVSLSTVEKAGYFSSVLNRVLASDGNEIGPDESWRHFYVFKYCPAGQQGRGRVFGLTSPTTLVATGAFYPDAMTEQDVPWFRRSPETGRYVLTDPTPILSDSERKALAEWILLVHASIGDTGTIGGGKLLTALKDFAADLDADLARDFNPDVTRGNSERILSDHPLGLSRGLSHTVDFPHRPEEHDLSHLVIHTDVASGPVRYVLIDPTAAQTFRKEPKEVVVHRGITLATVKHRHPETDSQKSGAFSPDLTWFTPAYFFQDYLLYDDSGKQASSSGTAPNPFPGCRNVATVGSSDPRRILLPINEEVTRLFSADTLAKNFSVQWSNSGEAVCRLRLMLKVVSLPDKDGKMKEGESRAFVITKTYTAAQMIKIGRPPFVGVWPNVRLAYDPARASKQKPWKRYYVFESWRGRKTADDFIVRPLNGVGKSSIKKSGDDLFQIQPCDDFPDFLTCEMLPRDQDGFEVKPKALMILLAPDVKPVYAGKRAALGIDFGTTGTSIYWAWDKEGSKPEQLQFKDRLLRVTAYDSSELELLTREVFIPARDWASGKILSVYQVFGAHVREEVLDGHVLFSDDANPAAFIARDRTGDVRSNLKWGDKDQSDAADGFLAQLCIESLLELIAEGADSVDIRYSFPTAFSFDDKIRFMGIWDRVIKRVIDATSIEVTNNKDEKENREAVAATRYFAKSDLGLAFSRGALTLDIGGGTTDIALWSRDSKNNVSLPAHLSVMLAGRDVFLNAVRQKPAVLGILDSTLTKGAWDKLLDLVKTPDAYNAQLDAMISSRGGNMLDGLPGNEDKVEGLLNIMATGLCGIGFYAGLLTGRVVQKGEYTPDKVLPVFVGGNGSQLMRWCSLKYFRPEVAFYKKLAASILAGCKVGGKDVNVQVKISLSPDPKQEVAYGLVAYGLGSEKDDLHISDEYTNPMAGENYLIRGQTEPASWDQIPSADEIRQKAISVDPAMTQFTAFLAATGVKVSDDSMTQIIDRIDERLRDMGSAANKEGDKADQYALDQLRKEPIFILAVKALLDIQIGAWVKDE